MKDTNATVASVKALPVDQVHTVDQVRTRNGFDKTSISQLADSLAKHGMLQPIIVRPDPEADEGFIVIAGHRRLAAAKLAGFDHVPAIVTTAETQNAFEVQLLENIQRENLTLADTADAVRKLAAVHGKAKVIAGIVNKSTGWVSKHLAITSPSFSPEVRALLDDGHTEDLELLVTLNSIAKHPDGEAKLKRLVAGVQSGHVSRQAARDALDALKADAQGELDLEEEEGEGAETETKSFTAKLTIEEHEKLHALGSLEWLRKQIKRAKIVPPAHI